MTASLTVDQALRVVVDAVNRANPSRAAIARRIGISESTMHRKMTGRGEFTVAESMQIMDALGLKLAEEWRRAARVSTAGTPPQHL